MKNFVSAQSKMRVRNLRESVSQAKQAVNGMARLAERERNPEKVVMLEEEIQHKLGIIASMENQIEMLEGRKK